MLDGLESFKMRINSKHLHEKLIWGGYIYMQVDMCINYVGNTFTRQNKLM